MCVCACALSSLQLHSFSWIAAFVREGGFCRGNGSLCPLSLSTPYIQHLCKGESRVPLLAVSNQPEIARITLGVRRFYFQNKSMIVSQKNPKHICQYLNRGNTADASCLACHETSCHCYLGKYYIVILSFVMELISITLFVNAHYTFSCYQEGNTCCQVQQKTKFIF